MEDNKTTTESTKRFTYEQLEKIATELSSQVQQLSARLNEANMFNTFKRLDYCFKVMELSPEVSASFFSPEFVERCAEEIEELMTPAQTVEKE